MCRLVLAVLVLVPGGWLIANGNVGTGVSDRVLVRAVRASGGTAAPVARSAHRVWCAETSASDRPPAEPGPTIHLAYALPSDGADRLAEVGPRLAAAAETVESWWRREDSRRMPRFDRHMASCGPQLDVTTLRLNDSSRSLARYADVSSLITGEVPDTGLAGEHTITIVYYDGPGGLPEVCGEGGGTLNEAGIGIVYLNACSGVPDDRLLAHELVHALGALPTGAPHPCAEDDPGHPCDDPSDVLWPVVTEAPLEQLRLDASRDDYYDHDGAWPDLRDSVYLRRLGDRPTRLGIAIRGEGSVSSPVPGLSCQTACTTRWDARMTIPINAAPARGQRFIRWEGACSGRRECSVSLDGKRLDLAAVFASPTVRLSVAVRGHGRISAGPAWSCRRTCSRAVRSYAPLRLRAYPAKGWRLAGWSRPCRAPGDSCLLPMERETSVQALFSRED